VCERVSGTETATELNVECLRERGGITKGGGGGAREREHAREIRLDAAVCHTQNSQALSHISVHGNTYIGTRHGACTKETCLI